MRRLRAGGGGAQPRRAPGFVGNRLQFALLREALHIVHSGIASRRWWTGNARLAGPPLCDGRPTGGCGHDRPGDGPPDICQHLLPELASGTEMMSLVAEKVARGDTGARSGQGFYRWDEARHQRIQSRREHQLRFALKP